MKPIFGSFLSWFVDDAIAGDLLEAYREDHFNKLGRFNAELWLIRQVLSIVWHRIPGGLLMLSLLSTVCAAWLVLMECLLQHNGFIGRSFNDSLVILQSALALFGVAAPQAETLRSLAFGVTGMVLLNACWALYGAASNPHFEGYAVVAASLFIAQSIASFAQLRSASRA